MNRPSFTIVMPVYNAGEFLKLAVQDVLQQTYSQYDFIAVDDGSDDSSLKNLQALVEEKDTCRILSQRHCGGGIARNTGLSQAKGDYVIFLDADDRFDKDLLQSVAREIAEKQSDIVVFAADKFRYGTKHLLPLNAMLRPYVLSEESQKNKLLTKNDCYQKVLQFTGTTVWNKAFRRKFLIEHNIRFQDNKGADTLLFTLLALCCAEKISYTEDILIHYREGNPTGQIAMQNQTPLSGYHALIAAKHELIQRNLYNGYKKTFVHFAIENCLFRFENVTSYNEKKALYDVLHDSGLCELGGNDSNAVTEEYFGKTQAIIKYSYDEYLHIRQEKMILCGMTSKHMFILPKLNVGSGSRIVLYGCGNVGKSYYTQIMNLGIHHIVLWVDRDYAKAMLPVTAPEQIFKTDYDLILLAIEQKKVAEEIKLYLIDKKVSDNKIFWQQPTVI